MAISTKLAFALFCCVSFFSCGKKDRHTNRDIVKDPAAINAHVLTNIRETLTYAEAREGRTSDSVRLNYSFVLRSYYADAVAPLWSDRGVFVPAADSFFVWLNEAGYAGLFKEDYGYSKINSLRASIAADSLKRSNASVWTEFDLLYSNAFAGVLRDLSQGRIVPDSLHWKNDTAKHRTFFAPAFTALREGVEVRTLLSEAEPANKSYRAIRTGLRDFVDTMDQRIYTLLAWPYKDSAAFVKTLKSRLTEHDSANRAVSDSAGLANAIKKYQKSNGLEADGKQGPQLVRSLNNFDRQKFNRVAVTLDRYKQLPKKFPEKYIWVNLPAFSLEVWRNDTLDLYSKIICGKTNTPTPALTAAITDIVIYPTWTVPSSIIKKEMLPALRRNPGYLARKGMYLLNKDGDRIDPYSVNWAAYSKGIPYRIQQGSGDDNALGVIKFNFNNPFDVYLHDTNQRYLFKNSSRSLSHGCVRVQQWKELVALLVRNDSLHARRGDTLRYNTDSISNWIAAKERHRIDLRNKFPLYIRYFTCGVEEGRLKFYEDIYGEDRALLQKYFAGK